MKYTLQISEEAILDASEASIWLEQQIPGLSSSFDLCMDAALMAIQRNPKICQVRYKKVRVVFTERFPYGIHYIIVKNEIRVLGVFHTSKSPSNWVDRLK